MITSIINFVMWLAGLFGFGKPPDDVADQRKADRQSGIDAATAAAATQEVSELQTAAKARQDSETAHVSETPDQIRQNAQVDPNARKFDPDAVG